jgi:uncharacterized OsmC-like protein
VSGERSVRVERVAAGSYRAVNARGATIDIGTGDDATFSPVELLLAAIGACSSVDLDLVTSRRTEPDRFTVTVRADKVSDEAGNRLTDIAAEFDVAFPAGAAGDKARTLTPRLLRQSHDRLCTVSRTIEAGTPVRIGLAE